MEARPDNFRAGGTMNNPHELDRMVLLVRDLISEEIGGEQIIETFQSIRVHCIANSRNLTSHAGQTALVTFVTLVARMGVQVFLDIPEIKLVEAQIPLHGGFLKDGLMDIGRNLIPGSLVHDGVPDKPDLVFIFGDTPYCSIGKPAWRVSGEPWVGRILPIGCAGISWSGLWPIGSLTAATLAAAEVFKAAVRRLQPESDKFENLLTGLTTSASWDFGSHCPVPEHIEIGYCDFVSAGAINQALLFALAQIPDH